MTTLSAGSHAADSQPLDRRRVYIFPSRAGLTLACMLLVILLGAINYDNALAYLLSFLLAGLYMVAMLHTYRNLAGLRFTGAYAAPVFAGETADFVCQIDNTSPRARLNLVFKYWPRERKRSQRRYLERFASTTSIPAHAQGLVTVARDAERRGWLALTRVVMHSEYPLGIMRAWAYFESDARCLVYPTPRGHLPLPGTHPAASGTSSASDSGSDDFAGLRRYRPGDPVRAIAWKTLAKAQALMVKRFSGQAAAELHLSWAAVSAIAGTEARLSQLTAWVLAAEREGAMYALELPGTRIDVGHGAQHRGRCLRALALFESTP